MPLLLSCVLLASCGRPVPVLKVGLVAPFEGRYRSLGYDVIYSARLAVREVNSVGGIQGRYVALVSLDDSGETDLAQGAAASLVVDPAVVAVVGHWLPETTAAAASVYTEGGMPFIQAGELPFVASDPANLPPSFRARYESVTPFDEAAGPYAAASYDAFHLLWSALELASQDGEVVDRAAMSKALSEVELSGLVGTVYWPEPGPNR